MSSPRGRSITIFLSVLAIGFWWLIHDTAPAVAPATVSRNSSPVPGEESPAFDTAPVSPTLRHEAPSAQATDPVVASKAATKNKPQDAAPQPEAPLIESEESFQKLIVDVQRSIPSREQLGRLSEDEIHNTPTVVQNAAIEMGRLSEALEGHPEFSDQARGFYENCALETRYPNSIRTSCYVDLIRLLKRQGLTSGNFSRDQEVPEHIKAMARSLL